MSSGAEDLIHAGIVDLLQIAGRRDVIWWHTPSGGLRHPGVARKLKALGTRPGIPDLAFLLPEGGDCWLEIKTKTGRVSPEQAAFLAFAAARGDRCAVVRSIDEAHTVLAGWGIV